MRTRAWSEQPSQTAGPTRARTAASPAAPPAQAWSPQRVPLPVSGLADKMYTAPFIEKRRVNKTIPQTDLSGEKRPETHRGASGQAIAPSGTGRQRSCPVSTDHSSMGHR
jgi:hypothetical protein